MVKIRLKDGEYYHKPSGYIMVYDARRKECIPKHRYIVEKHLGRRLRPDEFVHHKDNNKKNNALSNLQIMYQHDHNVMRHKHETNFYGRNNPSKNMTAARKAQMRRLWIKRKRMYGSTGARDPSRLRRLGAVNGRNH